MTYRSLLVAAALLLGCPNPCPKASGFKQIGEAPLHSDLVLQAAGERCDLSGLTVRWVKDGHGYAGLNVPVSCGWWVDVEIRPDAFDTAEAHELGHHCLKNQTDEAAANAWAAEVNGRARVLAGERSAP
jgi:hypothetical protein